jgi:Sideroflexins
MVFFVECSWTIMAETGILPDGRLDIDKPLWSQDTFIGRLKHFAWMTDFRTAVVPSSSLHEAKILLEQYRYIYVVISSSLSCNKGHLSVVYVYQLK